MKIKGTTKLNKNMYDTIFLHPRGIRIEGKDTFPTIKSDHPFTETLNGLSDEEVRSEVINHFLRNSRLNILSDNYYHAGKKYLLVAGDRTLKSSIDLSKKEKERIHLKYQIDRINSLSKIKAEKIDITLCEGCTSYFQDEEGILLISICSKDGKPLEYEKQFLENYLDEILKDNIVYLKERYELDDIHSRYQIFLGNYIEGSDIEVKISSYKLISLIEKIIFNHNLKVKKQIEEEKKQMKLQLKMEGI